MIIIGYTIHLFLKFLRLKKQNSKKKNLNSKIQSLNYGELLNFANQK